jgi:hypothetical protein
MVDLVLVIKENIELYADFTQVVPNIQSLPLKNMVSLKD